MDGRKPSVYHKVSEMFHAFPSIVWLLGLGCVINIGGLSLLWPVNAIYIHYVLHKPMAVSGLVLMLYSGAGFVGSLLGGWLYDKVGAMWVLVLGLVLSTIVILVPVVYSEWWVYVCVMGVFGLTSAMPSPAINALAGHIWPEGGRRAYNFIYVANNIGVAVGTALGGVIAGWSFRAVFYGIAISYLLYFLLLIGSFRPRLKKVQARTRKSRDGHTVAQDLRGSIPWGVVGVLLAGFITSWIVYVQWQCSISVYMKDLGFPLEGYSLLWTLNGLLIFLAQPIISKVVKRFPQLSLHMRLGVILFALAYAGLLLSQSYWIFVIAMIIMSFGEMLMWPAVPAAVAQVSPQERAGTLQGLVGSAATFGRMLGPVFGGYLWDQFGVHNLLWVLVFFSVVPLLFYYVYRVQERASELSIDPLNIPH